MCVAWGELKLAPSARSGNSSSFVRPRGGSVIGELLGKVGMLLKNWSKWKDTLFTFDAEIVVVSPATSELNRLSESWRSAAVKAGSACAGVAGDTSVERLKE